MYVGDLIDTKIVFYLSNFWNRPLSLQLISLSLLHNTHKTVNLTKHNIKQTIELILLLKWHQNLHSYNQKKK